MKFAERVTQLTAEGAYHMLARAQALESTGRAIIHLEIGQPDIPTFKNIAQAGIRAIESGFTRYTPSAGTQELRQAIARDAGKRRGIEVLLTLGEQADQGECALPDGLVIEDELALRQERLANLAKAKAVLDARAQERDAAEQAAYQAKLQEREEKARQKRRKPRGRPPQPPPPGPRDQDQYNFTDPDSRIMKNSTDEGFDQHYNAQAAVDQASLLIVATSLSNHPNDKQEAEPTLDAISPRIGTPEAAALDNGYWSPGNFKALEDRGIDAYIATGREQHHVSWETFFAKQPAPPTAEASPLVKMAYKLQTEIGRAIYRLRKMTVERP